MVKKWTVVKKVDGRGRTGPVAHNRMPDVGQVHPKLVPPPRPALPPEPSEGGDREGKRGRGGKVRGDPPAGRRGRGANNMGRFEGQDSDEQKSSNPKRWHMRHFLWQMRHASLAYGAQLAPGREHGGRLTATCGRTRWNRGTPNWEMGQASLAHMGPA